MDDHEWFYDELKEVPKENKTKISDLVDVKINIEPAGLKMSFMEKVIVTAIFHKLKEE